MLNTKKLKQILSRYNIQINRTDEFLLAMTHSSFANEHKLESNERIEEWTGIPMYGCCRWKRSYYI